MNIQIFGTKKSADTRKARIQEKRSAFSRSGELSFRRLPLHRRASVKEN